MDSICDKLEQYFSLLVPAKLDILGASFVSDATVLWPAGNSKTRYSSRRENSENGGLESAVCSDAQFRLISTRNLSLFC